MTVHVPVEVFNRYPWAGVVLGALGLALALAGCVYTSMQYRHFGDQPKRIAATTARPGNSTLYSGDWVRLDGALTVLCESKMETLHDWEQSLIFGRVNRTFYLAHTPGKENAFILEVSGEVGCDSVKQRELVGVLSEPSSLVTHLFEP